MAEAIYSAKDINKAIRSQAKKGKTTKIEGLTGQHNIAAGLSSAAKVLVIGEAGDFFGALNRGTPLSLKGDSGRFLGDTMISGPIEADGNTKDGAGANMLGGKIVVKGNAGSRVGAGAKGGLIIIDGDVGDFLGMHLFKGDIVVTGDAGKNVGLHMSGGTIFVNGDIGSLGRDAKIGKTDKNDKSRLVGYLNEEGFAGDFKFKKVTAQNEIELDTIKGLFGLAPLKSKSRKKTGEDPKKENE